MQYKKIFTYLYVFEISIIIVMFWLNGIIAGIALSKPPRIKWNRYYGGDGTEMALDLLWTTDGGFLLVGSTDSYGAGDYDAYIVKTDEMGVMKWNITYGGKYFDQISDIIQCNDGSYMLLGSTESFDASGTDFWVVKMNSTGIIEWNKTYHNIADEYGAKLLQTSDEGFVLVGTADTWVSNQGWVVKIYENGSTDWSQTYGGLGSERIRAIIIDPEGNFVIAGEKESYPSGVEDYWLFRINSTTGTVLWERTYNLSIHDSANDLLQTVDGGFLIGGEIYNSATYDRNMWVVKTDENGTEEWNHTYGHEYDDSVEVLVQTDDSGYALAGYTFSVNEGGGVDIWLVKIDSNGNEEWNLTYGGSGYESVNAIYTQDNRTFFLAGSSNSQSNNLDMLFVKIMDFEEETSVTTTMTTPTIPPTITRPTTTTTISATTTEEETSSTAPSPGFTLVTVLLVSIIILVVKRSQRKT